ncbi:MAG: deoxyguanosinetriphosphate triphosphohydrolase [Lachnospiraceae bacterium]|nr:deoxyguanosinetriphosphate triphosphohydrolase [Lachnospiraceae bacterium]
MLIREELENAEKERLSPYATLSVNSKGRMKEEEPCDIRPVFSRDRDRIVHSKAFRRLKDKTQVFLNPEGDHYRTRLTHTLEVAQIARTIARALKMNEELVEAIALGHDLGHTPFGHAGERALNEVCPLGFRHNEQSVRVVDVLERDGEGLNLTMEVRDGMEKHKMSSNPATPEGRIVRLSDKLAYIHHDMDDAIRARVLTDRDVPAAIGEVLGYTTKERLDTMIHSIISCSAGSADIRMDEVTERAMVDMRSFMFERVYQNPIVKSEETKAETLIKTLYAYYIGHKDELPYEYQKLLAKGDCIERVCCDYVASMTDHYAISVYENIYIPKSWHG